MDRTTIDIKTEKLKDMIANAKSVSFLGGAGVSTESGIPDFRSENGIYDAIRRYGYPPETLLSHDFFVESPEVFYDYYKSSLLVTDKSPNKAHIALAKLEQDGKLTGVVTQNIDGLHSAAGSKRVYELHGSIFRNHCTKCNKFFTAEYIKSSNGVPYCDECGGIIKPDVVLYGESLEDAVIRGAINAIVGSDLLIVGGTSLQVYPAAGLVQYCTGKIVLINMSQTPYDRMADLVINDKIGVVLGRVVYGIG